MSPQGVINILGGPITQRVTLRMVAETKHGDENPLMRGWRVRVRVRVRVR